MYKYLPLLFILTSCRYGAGLAIHPTSLDDQTSDKPNPIAVIRIEQDIDNVQIYYEHVSSIPRSNEDYGLNLLGVNIMFGDK